MIWKQGDLGGEIRGNCNHEQGETWLSNSHLTYYKMCEKQGGFGGGTTGDCKH